MIPAIVATLDDSLKRVVAGRAPPLAVFAQERLHHRAPASPCNGSKAASAECHSVQGSQGMRGLCAPEPHDERPVVSGQSKKAKSRFT
jgi:hypothetical protein